jgi:hypothetical protein
MRRIRPGEISQAQRLVPSPVETFERGVGLLALAGQKW